MEVITIGRSSKNDVVIHDNLVSRVHLQILHLDDGRFVLNDLGSTNGTYVNGRRAYGEAPLHPGDSIRIGNTNLDWQAYFKRQDDKGDFPVIVYVWTSLLIAASLAIGILTFWQCNTTRFLSGLAILFTGTPGILGLITAYRWLSLVMCICFIVGSVLLLCKKNAALTVLGSSASLWTVTSIVMAILLRHFGFWKITLPAIILSIVGIGILEFLLLFNNKKGHSSESLLED